MEIFGLRTADIQQLLEVLYSLPEVEEVWLFGSRAKGNYRKGSDIDLAIKGRSLTNQQLLQLQVAVDDLWLPYYIDVLHYDTLSDEAVKAHIDQYGIPLPQAEWQNVDL